MTSAAEIPHPCGCRPECRGLVAHGARAVGIERDTTSLASRRAPRRWRCRRPRRPCGAGPSRPSVSPDIHARPLAHGIEPLEHLDRFGVVIGGRLKGVLRARSAMPKGASDELSNRLRKARRIAFVVTRTRASVHHKVVPVRYCQSHFSRIPAVAIPGRESGLKRAASAAAKWRCWSAFWRR